jgi:hypothetical protein
MKFMRIAAEKGRGPVDVQCEALSVSRSGYSATRAVSFPCATDVSNPSNSLTAARPTAGSRCAYHIVFSIVACPSSSLIALNGTPLNE